MSGRLARARSALPVTAERNYLGTGSFGPISQTYSVTLRRATLETLRHGRIVEPHFEAVGKALERIRGALAGILGADAAEVALTRSTSASLEAAVREFPLEPGDEVICTPHEHPALTVPLSEQARRRGFSVVLAQVPEQGAEDLRWLSQCVTSKTRLIAFSGVSFTTGQRLPIERIGEFAVRRGIRTLLDAAQCVGAIPLDPGAAGIDLCAFPLQKWLCGPEGIGALYVRSGSLDALRRDRLTQSLGVLEATAAHLDWMAEAIGWPFVFERTLSLASGLREAVRDQGKLRLVTPEAHAGLVCFETERGRYATVMKKLKRRRIVLRAWPELDRYRVSTAFFNTEKEIASLLSAFH